MKLLRLLPIILLAINTYAQEIVPLENQIDIDLPNNIYFKDVNNYLTPFIGYWEYNKDGHYLKLEITKSTRNLVGGGHMLHTNYEDLIDIKLIYKKNGVEKYNFENTKDKIFGNLIIDKNTINLHYNEPSLTSSCRLVSARLKLKIVPPSSGGMGNGAHIGDLKWERINYLNEGLHPNSKCFDGQTIDSSDFIIPDSLVLKRLL